mmetsp:Transcript_32744/g.82153  ORF Transcript_32744/g.82153 Transcript_32744/m.82153 type:complete len:416 (-) Transcript_32744:544-1791(-)|eukprot:CAMPEP_0174246256 /NCGR_PEP_ID=MMETSP0417-20130205/41979_1 /TAXON_ID=242541 /ORGANISM="Mayorella sp, Strain BSH-02190019" /LENGTH=415 /DNA_ID=CAMNT_0015326109 /DNA_START=683 /DNA_END=1930 /DNA_ORIENTATION=-
MMLSTAPHLTIQLPDALTTSVEHGVELPTSPTDCLASPWTELPFELELADIVDIAPLSSVSSSSASVELFGKSLQPLHEMDHMDFLCGSGDNSSPSLLDMDLDAELCALDEAIADFSDSDLEDVDADDDDDDDDLCSGDDLTLFEETQLLLAEAESTISYAAEQQNHRRLQHLETVSCSPPSPPHYSREQSQRPVVLEPLLPVSSSRRAEKQPAFKVPSKPFIPNGRPVSPTPAAVRCLSPAAGIVRRHRAAAGSAPLRKQKKRTGALPEPFRLQSSPVRRQTPVSAVHLSPLRLSAPAPQSSPLSDRLRSELAAAGIDALVLQQQLARARESRRPQQPESPASPAAVQMAAAPTSTQCTLKCEVAASATAPKSNRVTPLVKIGFSATHIERTFSREEVVVVTSVETDEFVDIMC